MIDLSDHTRVVIGRTMAVITIGLAGVSLVIAASFLSAAEMYDRWILHNNLIPAALAVLGWILVRAQPRSRLVWLILWDAWLNVINGVAATASELVLDRRDPVTGSLGGTTGPADLTYLEAITFNLGSWLWIPPVALLGTLALLWFPDGRVPTKRWRVVEAMALLSTMAVTAIVAWQTRPFGDYTYPTATLAADAHPLMRLVLIIGFVGLLASVVLSVVSLGVRYRSSRGVARRQLRWIVWGAGTMSGLGVSAMVFDVAVGTTGNPVFQAATWIGLMVYFTGYGLAIRREQLFDIDVVLSKTLLVGFLTLFITVVYVTIVFGLGTVIGRSTGGDQRLSLVATVAVAFAFQPVRRWLEHIANLLVYGKRATPYEVLSDLASRLTNAESVGGLLDRMAERLAAATAADAAVLWRAAEAGFQPAAVWPAELTVAPVTELPAGSVPIQRAGTVLGGLSVTKKRGDEMTPTEHRLMADLAGSAALVMDKVRLDTALDDQARQLFESRRRQVDAQDEERQRLEHHLNDTTHRQLLHLKDEIGLAAVQADLDGADAVAQQLATLGDDAKTAADEVQALAQGIFPPLLETEGLVSAVQNLADRLPLPIRVEDEVDSSSIGQLNLEIQVAIYFCVAEALTNVVKHAAATRAVVHIVGGPDAITFTVTDDGRGFEPADRNGLSTGLTGISDRIEAVGGHLTVDSNPYLQRGLKTGLQPGAQPSYGTTITGTVGYSAVMGRSLAASIGG